MSRVIAPVMALIWLGIAIWYGAGDNVVALNASLAITNVWLAVGWLDGRGRTS